MKMKDKEIKRSVKNKLCSEKRQQYNNSSIDDGNYRLSINKVKNFIQIDKYNYVFIHVE